MRSRTDEGFTLAETLIALFVVSIAMGCVLAGFALLSRFEHATQNQLEARRADDAIASSLSQAVSIGESLAPNAFKGDEHHLDFACGSGATGNPRLCTLEWRNDLHLGFISNGIIHKAWPKNSAGGGVQLPEALILQTVAGTTVSVVRIEAEQGRDCQFDTVSRTCRGETIQNQ